MSSEIKAEEYKECRRPQQEKMIDDIIEALADFFAGKAILAVAPGNSPGFLTIGFVPAVKT